MRRCIAACAMCAAWALSSAAEVTTTPIVTVYPSQQYVVLNASGYVVAQRKAAIASKATGRLEWLGVAEGSQVKAGDIIARLDNRDVVAQAQSAEAGVRGHWLSEAVVNARRKLRTACTTGKAGRLRGMQVSSLPGAAHRGKHVEAI